MMFFFFFKQKTAYEMRISDWSSDVCSSDLHVRGFVMVTAGALAERPGDEEQEHRYHDDQAPAIGEMPDFVIGHRAAPEAASGACACSCGAAFSTSTSVPSICR